MSMEMMRRLTTDCRRLSRRGRRAARTGTRAGPPSSSALASSLLDDLCCRWTRRLRGFTVWRHRLIRDTPLTLRLLRSNQHRLGNVLWVIERGQTEARDILAVVTPGGGKSLLPMIEAARLMEAGLIDRVCWIVPRDSLRLQAEEAFADPAGRTSLGHGLSVRAAESTPDPSGGWAAVLPPTRVSRQHPTCI